MTLKQTKQRGFTIVELLIVVVIIAILAAITIVAYNGIQARAKTSSAASLAASLQKKFEAYALDSVNNPSGNYPQLISTLTGATADKLYYFPASGVTVLTAAITSGTATEKTITLNPCNSGKGYKISYWDFSAATPGVVSLTGGDQTSCTTYAAS